MSTGPARRKSRRPAVERLEGRDLPTSPLLLASPFASGDLRRLVSQAGTPAADADALARTPTPREMARQRFSAKYVGTFLAGPPRFTDQAAQFYIEAAGTSNMFLHGDLQMGVFTPADPAGRTTGLAALLPKDVAQSGNLLVLRLEGDASSLDPAGRPTRFDWTVDPSSGGTFTDAVGEGTVEVRYQPRGRLAARRGGANVIFQGRIETNGVTNIFRT